MPEDLSNEEYNKLLSNMYDLSAKMPEVIYFNYFDSNKYLYDVYLDAFNSLRGFCVLIREVLLSQASALLRMAMEKIATIRMLTMHPELMDEYIEHRKFRFELVKSNSKKKNDLIKEHYKDKTDFKKIQPTNYLEYGWLQPICDNECGLDSLIEKANIHPEPSFMKEWKDLLNVWVHGAVTFSNLVAGGVDKPLRYSNDLIIIAANLIGYLICDFHVTTNFNFVLGGIDYSKEFCIKKSTSAK